MLIIFCILIVIASLLGGIVPLLIKPSFWVLSRIVLLAQGGPQEVPSLSGPQSVAPRTILRTFVLCCLVGFVFYSSCPGRCPSQSMFGILWPESMVAELWFTQWRSQSSIL